MFNIDSNYRGTFDSDGKLSIESNMNDWHLISDNVCTKIDVLLDLINVREGNIRWDGFTGEEINFMIYDICVNLNCIQIEYVIFQIHFHLFICTIFNIMHILHTMYVYA